jgi:membrane-bound serine protease (ClpP class)
MILGAMVLLLLALALVVAELFLPSHGLLAILAALASIGAIVLAYRASPGAALIFAAIIFFAAPVVFYWAIRIYPTTPMGKRVLLEHPQAGVKAFADEAAQLEHLVGQQGTAITLLRPAGSVEVEGRIIDAMSDAEIIESGSRVEVLRVVGRKVIVKAV